MSEELKLRPCPFCGGQTMTENEEQHLSEEEAQMEFDMQRAMESMYDMNGDPLRDFMGNPW